MNKIIFTLLLIFAFSCKAQYLKLVISDSLFSYKIHQDGHLNSIQINIEISNISENKVGFVLDNKSLGVYEFLNNYVFEQETKEETWMYENIFSPRLMMYPHNEVKNLKLDFWGNSEYYTEMNIAIAAKEEERKDSIKTLGLKKYQKQYFPKKTLQFVEKAMYVNNNFIILKPNEKRSFKLLFDPRKYKYEGTFNGIGFQVEKNKKYDFVVKIHSDKEVIMKFLNSENIRAVKKDNIKLLSTDLISKRLILNVN